MTLGPRARASPGRPWGQATRPLSVSLHPEGLTPTPAFTDVGSQLRKPSGARGRGAPLRTGLLAAIPQLPHTPSQQLCLFGDPWLAGISGKWAGHKEG